MANPQEKYDFERPKTRRVVTVETMATIGYVFNNPKFKTIYEKDLKTLTSGYGYVVFAARSHQLIFVCLAISWGLKTKCGLLFLYFCRMFLTYTLLRHDQELMMVF